MYLKTAHTFEKKIVLSLLYIHNNDINTESKMNEKK